MTPFDSRERLDGPAAGSLFRQRIGRYYEITLDGDLLPIRVVVPIQDDDRKEEHDAIMFARAQMRANRQGRILRGCQRGGLVAIKDPDV